MTAPARPPFAGHTPTIGLLFRQVRDASRDCLQREVARAGHELSFSQYLTIKALAQGSAGVSELARAADLHPGAMTRLLDRLAERGVVERVTDPADRRAVVVSLTASGQAIWRDVQPCAQRIHERALAGIDEATRAQLMRLVEQVRDNLLSPD